MTLHWLGMKFHVPIKRFRMRNLNLTRWVHYMLEEGLVIKAHGRMLVWRKYYLTLMFGRLDPVFFENDKGTWN